MIKTIALDLEGTLISNAMSQFPRPGLYDFLVGCKQVSDRVVIYTTVNENRFRSIAELLVSEDCAPEWFSDIEYVNWSGPTKDLAFIPEIDISQVFLVDDCDVYRHPAQEEQWIGIEQFASPYSDKDEELVRVLELLRSI